MLKHDSEFITPTGCGQTIFINQKLFSTDNYRFYFLPGSRAGINTRGEGLRTLLPSCSPPPRRLNAGGGSRLMLFIILLVYLFFIVVLLCLDFQEGGKHLLAFAPEATSCGILAPPRLLRGDSFV